MAKTNNPSVLEQEKVVPEEKKTESNLSVYTPSTELENIYKSAIGELNQNLESDKRQAYFNNEKLMKYLPNNLKVQGLQNNAGAMSQSYIDANNAYQNNLNSISKEYNSQKTELTNDYNIQKYQEQKDLSSQMLESRLGNLSSYASQFDVNEKGQYSSEDLNKIQAYADTLTEGLVDADKKLLEEGLSQYMGMSQEDEKQFTSAQRENKAKELGIEKYSVSKDATAINNDSADETSFGNHVGVKNKGSKQSQFTNDIIWLAKQGAIKDGTIIDLNYGGGKADNYVYINGYWFKTSKNANYDYKNYMELSMNLNTKNKGINDEIVNNINKLKG
jgi:hypothetical protein